MDNREAQERAIRLSAGDESAESREHMDKEGRVHQCPHCGGPVMCTEDEEEKKEDESLM